jgi:hypothetical protein
MPGELYEHHPAAEQANCRSAALCCLKGGLVVTR